MRVVLVGPGSRLERARRQLPDGVTVVAEATTLAEGRTMALSTDAFMLVVPSASSEEPLLEPLTPREAQVLELVADGLPNKAIAGILGVSDETIKFHLGSILGKLGASNRTDAVRIALQHGLVTI
jgi:DNA-binding NarL/FixJ family response regulator